MLIACRPPPAPRVGAGRESGNGVHDSGAHRRGFASLRGDSPPALSERGWPRDSAGGEDRAEEDESQPRKLPGREGLAEEEAEQHRECGGDVPGKRRSSGPEVENEPVEEHKGKPGTDCAQAQNDQGGDEIWTVADVGSRRGE